MSVKQIYVGQTGKKLLPFADRDAFRKESKSKSILKHVKKQVESLSLSFMTAVESKYPKATKEQYRHLFLNLLLDDVCITGFKTIDETIVSDSDEEDADVSAMQQMLKEQAAMIKKLQKETKEKETPPPASDSDAPPAKAASKNKKANLSKEMQEMSMGDAQ